MWLLEYAAAGGERGPTVAQYLKTEELLLGKAVTVDDLNLFDQGALPTFWKSWDKPVQKWWRGIKKENKNRFFAVDAPTEHQDFHHIHLCPGVLTEVLLYFGALECCLFTLLSDILVKAHSHTDLRRDSGLGYIFIDITSVVIKWPHLTSWFTSGTSQDSRHHQTPVRLKNKCGRTWWFYQSVTIKACEWLYDNFNAGKHNIQGKTARPGIGESK